MRKIVKFLSKQEQLGLLDRHDALKVMQKYVAQAGDFRAAERQVIFDANPERFRFLRQIYGELNQEQSEIYKNLSLDDALAISQNGGHIYSECWEKMLDVLPKEEVKEMLLLYNEECCNIWEGTLTKILKVYPKEEAKDLLADFGYVSANLLVAVLAVFSEAEVKEWLLRVCETTSSVIDDESEVMLLHIYPKEDAKEIVRACIMNTPGWCDEAMIELFKLFSRAEVREILKLAIDNEQYLSREILLKIIDYFPFEEAEELIEDFFASGPATEYRPEEEAFIRDELQKKRL